MAYHVEWKHQFSGLTCRALKTGTSLNNSIWKILCKLKLPAKVKIFCWRVLHGILPLKDILVKRHIDTDAICPLCTLAREVILHMIIKCQGAVNIWRALGMGNTIEDASSGSSLGTEVLQSLFQAPISNFRDILLSNPIT
jgi:hypothetical protein